MKSKCYQIALEIENGKLPNEKAIDVPSDLSQPQIDDMSSEYVSTQEAYVSLMNTAYELVINPAIFLQQFEMMIIVQQKNCLIHFRLRCIVVYK